MDPATLAKSGTEHAHQRAYFQWLNTWSPDINSVTFAIPNGGARGDHKTAKIRGGAMKAEGVKSGVPDIMCAWPMFSYESKLQYNGLFIEMKKARGGVVSDNQAEWRVRLIARGYKVVTCYNWQEAANATAAYFGQPTIYAGVDGGS